MLIFAAAPTLLASLLTNPFAAKHCHHHRDCSAWQPTQQGASSPQSASPPLSIVAQIPSQAKLVVSASSSAHSLSPVSSVRSGTLASGTVRPVSHSASASRSAAHSQSIVSSIRQASSALVIHSSSHIPSTRSSATPATHETSLVKTLSTSTVAPATTSSTATLSTVLTTATSAKATSSTQVAAPQPSPDDLNTAQLTLQQFGLLHQDGSVTYNNIKLSWPEISGAASYDILRSSDATTYTKVQSVPASFADDYDLPAGSTFYYYIQAHDAQGAVVKATAANSVTLSPAPPAADIKEISNYYNDNVFLSTVSPNKRAETYSFSIGQDPSNNNQPMIVQRSSSGVTTTVLSSKELCSATGGSCRLESIRFVDNPSTGEKVLWAHYEGASGYSEARVVVAWGKPGNQWTFGGAFHPTGRDSRDLTFFTDAKGAGYIISSTSMNSDLAIYALTADWHNVTGLAALVNVGQHREAPGVLYRDGWYYLFSSGTAGWLPTDAGVIVAKDIAGPWSPMYNPASVSTFGTQSGWITGYGSTSLMNAPRWAAYWPVPQEYMQLTLPISVANGYASYHFYKTVQQDAKNQVALGIQSGRLSSVGATSKSSGGSGESFANDGKANSGSELFKPSKVPFWYEVDLGSELPIEQIDLTTPLVGGSEIYYSFTVSASKDGSAYSTISDQTDNKNIGFTSFLVKGKPSARYVRINVSAVKNIQNGANGDWNAGINEFSVYTQ